MPGTRDNVLKDSTAQKHSAGQKGGSREHGTRFRLGSYFADIVPDEDGVAPVFHWIIQRVGLSEILALGQETSFSRALEQAHWHLKNLAKRRAGTEKRRAVFYEFGELKKAR